MKESLYVLAVLGIGTLTFWGYARLLRFLILKTG